MTKEKEEIKTVKQLLEDKERELWTITPETVVINALELMAQKNVGALPVVMNGKLTGIFSERDYARNIVLKGKSSQQTTVGDLMIEDVISVSLADTLENCMALMAAHHIRHLPVIDTDQLVGILTLGDVVKHIVSDQRRKIQHLEKLLGSEEAG